MQEKKILILLLFAIEMVVLRVLGLKKRP